jgi:hypothetical protein
MFSRARRDQVDVHRTDWSPPQPSPQRSTAQVAGRCGAATNSSLPTGCLWRSQCQRSPYATAPQSATLARRGCWSLQCQAPQETPTATPSHAATVWPIVPPHRHAHDTDQARCKTVPTRPAPVRSWVGLWPSGTRAATPSGPMLHRPQALECFCRTRPVPYESDGPNTCGGGYPHLATLHSHR